MNELVPVTCDKCKNELEKQGFYTVVKEVKNYVNENLNGTYIAFGFKKNSVENLTFDSDDMIRSYNYQKNNNSLIFPHCKIVKMDGNMLNVVSELSLAKTQAEFINGFCKRFDLTLPSEVVQRDYMQAMRAYMKATEKEADEMGREHYAKCLEDDFKIITSGMTQEEYEKKNGLLTHLADKRAAKKLDELAKNSVANSVKIYESSMPSCISNDELNQNNGVYKTLNVDHDALSMIEQELSKTPEIQYTIQREAMAYPYGEYGYKFYHMFRFPEIYEPIVAPIIHKYEFGIKDITKKYSNLRNDNVYGVSIPVSEFKLIYNECAADNVKIYFDQKGIYANSTTKSIGVTTETPLDQAKLQNILSRIYGFKLQRSVFDRESSLPINERKIKGHSNEEFDNKIKSISKMNEEER